MYPFRISNSVSVHLFRAGCVCGCQYALVYHTEDLQTQLLTKFVDIMIRAQTLQTNHLDSLKTHIITAEDALKAVDPSADQNLFIEYNINPFSLPPDWGFEPNATHYDNASRSFEQLP